MKSKLALPILIGALSVVPIMAVAATASAAAPKTATVNWQTPLHGSLAYPQATGNSQYQSQPGQSELQVEVEHLRALVGKQLLVRGNGATVGKMRVSKGRRADLTLNSEVGQTVPSIVHGSKVTVTTAAGRLVARGSY